MKQSFCSLDALTPIMRLSNQAGAGTEASRAQSPGLRLTPGVHWLKNKLAVLHSQWTTGVREKAERGRGKRLRGLREAKWEG